MAVNLEDCRDKIQGSNIPEIDTQFLMRAMFDDNNRRSIKIRMLINGTWYIFPVVKSTWQDSTLCLFGDQIKLEGEYKIAIVEIHDKDGLCLSTKYTNTTFVFESEDYLVPTYNLVLNREPTQPFITKIS